MDIKIYQMQGEAIEAAYRFGKNLRAVRKSKGLSQVALSEISGISAPAICNYEIGRRVPPLDTVACLCRALETNVDDMLYLNADELGRWTR